MNTGYFEELIQKYLLDNAHGAIVVVKPEKGRTARMEKELHDKLQAYKASLTKEEVKEIADKTAQLIAYQEEPSTQEELETIPVLEVEDISTQIQPIYNEEIRYGDILMVHHNVETNGIGYLDILFDLSQVPAELLPYVGILQSVLGVIDTTHYEYGGVFQRDQCAYRWNRNFAGNVSECRKGEEKEFKATFEIKAKALYHKLPAAFAMILNRF